MVGMEDIKIENQERSFSIVGELIGANFMVAFSKLQTYIKLCVMGMHRREERFKDNFSVIFLLSFLV